MSVACRAGNEKQARRAFDDCRVRRGRKDPLRTRCDQISVSGPFRSSRSRSFNDGPLGCFSPISHLFFIELCRTTFWWTRSKCIRTEGEVPFEEPRDVLRDARRTAPSALTPGRAHQRDSATMPFPRPPGSDTILIVHRPAVQFNPLYPTGPLLRLWSCSAEAHRTEAYWA
jgi:hypothetical protein